MESTVDKRASLKELDDLRKESADLRVPRPLIASYLEFRQNIHDSRERFEVVREGESYEWR